MRETTAAAGPSRVTRLRRVTSLLALTATFVLLPAGSSSASAFGGHGGGHCNGGHSGGHGGHHGGHGGHHGGGHGGHC
jgi:hypothetical protein